jgi:hypothetical protein
MAVLPRPERLAFSLDANLLGVTSNPKHMEGRPALGDVRMITWQPSVLRRAEQMSIGSLHTATTAHLKTAADRLLGGMKSGSGRQA